MHALSICYPGIRARAPGGWPGIHSPEPLTEQIEDKVTTRRQCLSIVEESISRPRASSLQQAWALSTSSLLDFIPCVYVDACIC